MDENPEFAAIEQARDLVIDSIAETMDLYGITRSVGILYGTMYMRDEMTLDEMREELQMSKPSMSTGVKKLQDLNVVKKTFHRGIRKHTFVAEKDFFKFFTNFFPPKWEREVQVNVTAIEEAQADLQKVLCKEDLDEDIKNEALQLYDQLESSKAYYDWLKRLAESVQTGEIFKFIPVETK
ncbi:transcriptional regulator GbsR [Bacillus subtilis]|jgi:DNA-binding transcriptional regulator GbsR (MarR family)|uniref:HTH-type transcriptional repressor GbsR n=4 Tax=Bacilli TaxID=91061 RepID=GBSR_BACSU|nr:MULTISPECIES: transcriptional regulator GbsR [Bacillales]NP_390985.1 transcriptional repressor for gbsAB [Bacillus subtilis subsp. subtilis str. 168]P71015.1 RecName: Full=HTH-type transcriptional repressor GbsR; AltName: Full=Glycine betaine synthesis regulator [Bacillus subtilis subsp. subtilis str. 168]AOL30857.1 transcriptional regulator [Alkalicoccobacillus gibsonii]BAM55173.1 transcriptional regulator [Bacillus subtilis BEST7613]AAC44366.1 ORF-2 upstream of gbsAB operon [Bacillus subt